MKKTAKYVYIITRDEPMEAEQELNLFRTCRKTVHIFAFRSSLNNEAILTLVNILRMNALSPQKKKTKVKITKIPKIVILEE